ncbi:copper amine oxidase N-terminal domain-containing protein [Fontibacillus sp. BL9]|uniref:copper amine oxidase N-terminal domain-containing protein n=1 Tax=Fontibacillus sp. BL9 TaxID=3389971 RepID=UPI0039790783
MKLKKTGIIFMSFILMLTMIPALSSAAKLSLRVEVNGNKISFPDAQPFVDKSNRVQVPVRFVSEALGAEVGWNGQTQKVTVELGEDVIVLTLGKKAFTVNGQTKQMDTVAQRKESRTFVPLRFVSEALGAKVKWDSELYTVEITTGLAADDTNELNDYTKPDGTFDWDAWEASRNVEGESVQKTSEGFKYNNLYNSGLVVSDGYRKEDGNKAVIFNFIITVGNVGGDNIDQQVKDVEEILRQRIDEATVNSIIEYIKQKDDREDKLQEKSFEDNTFKVVVQSKYWGNINVDIWYK